MSYSIFLNLALARRNMDKRAVDFTIDTVGDLCSRMRRDTSGSPIHIPFPKPKPLTYQPWVAGMPGVGR